MWLYTCFIVSLHSFFFLARMGEVESRDHARVSGRGSCMVGVVWERVFNYILGCVVFRKLAGDIVWLGPL